MLPFYYYFIFIYFVLFIYFFAVNIFIFLRLEQELLSEGALQIDPSERITIDVLCEQIGVLASSVHVDLKNAVEGVDIVQLSDAAPGDIPAGSLIF